MSWWILAFLSLFLWYRNEKYDRTLAVFIFTLGLVQLIEYGIHSGADPYQSGRALYITLWLQCLVLAIGTFVFTRVSDISTTTERTIHSIAEWNLLLFSIVFVVSLILSFSTSSIFSGVVGDSGHIEWSKDRGSLLGSWGWLYLIGVFFPLFLILAYYRWSDLGIAILIIYAILSAVYVMMNFPPAAFSSMWCYLALGFAFLAFYVGIIPCPT